jgi:molybdenum cofactor cytidylyltransferase
MQEMEMQNILLAAGLATRSGGKKLYLPWNGEPVLVHAARASLEAGLRTIVVTGYRHLEAERIMAPLLGPRLTLAYNKDFASGQGSSIICGTRLLDPGNDFFISLADMPLIEATHYRNLPGDLGTWDALRPACGTEAGHPVLLSHRLRTTILAQDPGFRMRDLLASFSVRTLQVTDRAYVTDIDTIEAYRNLTGG